MKTKKDLLTLLEKAIEIVQSLPEIPEPIATEPIATEPIATEPIATEPIATEPIVTIDKSLFDPSVYPLLDLLMSAEWPEAAPTSLICADTEEDKTERAEGILDHIGTKSEFSGKSLDGKKILDFGCGEGHVARLAGEMSGKAVGYDLHQSGSLIWENDENKFLLTTDFNKVVSNGPYDLVIVYDVLDHCADPVDVLGRIKSVASSDAKIFVRCHSWMSRHGAHLYKQFNKAWIQVFFTEDELRKMGLKLGSLQKYYFPVDTQRKWFSDAGLRISYQEQNKSTVEPFFRREEMRARIPQQYKNQFPEWQMSQSFNDYIVTL